LNGHKSGKRGILFKDGVDMLARLLRLTPSTYKRLARLSKEAERDGAYRVAKRLQAVVLNSAGQTSGELARVLKAPRSKVSEWLQRYQTDGVDGLLEGYRSGRPSELTDKQQQQLGDILHSGPLAYGLNNGIWTSPMIAWVIEEEFGVQYHPDHVRKLLHAWGFSVQRPRRILARADVAAQGRWRRRIYPNLKKRPKRGATRHWALIFTDEASFPQDLHATWSRVGCPPEVPVAGERKSVKILGAIELWRTRFDYRQDTVFNASTYLGFLEQLARRYRRQGGHHDSGTTPPTIRTSKCGSGSNPTNIGWRCINYRPTRQS
jgi:transposase